MNEVSRVLILRDHLSYIERIKNIERLRSEAMAKKAHADALQAETDTLVATGALEMLTVE